MSAEAARRRDVYNDSEATLRQVQGVLADLGTPGLPASEGAERAIAGLAGGAGLRDLVEVLTTTYGEIMAVIDSLRRSRGLLEQAAMERLKSTHEKLAEVSSATEMAAAGMLDGLDRALGLVDEMDDADGSGGTAERHGALRDSLREELHTLISLLQFQDITSQQLGYAGGVLLDIEDRMVELARVFDLRGLGQDEDALPERECLVAKTASTCDPAASHFDADSRQALADEIFR